MHKRGWTYFRIDGQINGKKVNGTGRIPFVYETSRQFSPWLKLRLEDGLTLTDSGKYARILDRNGKSLAVYKSGSFFKGLSRPWIGLHTIDTIRRDAAQNNIWFETSLIKGKDKARIVLKNEEVNLVYTININNDVVEKVVFSTNNNDKGELNFEYLQSIDDLDGEFITPKRSGRSTYEDSPGVLWLFNLIENSQ
jgi:hypothetical protein